MKQRNTIPFYKEINDFLAGIHSRHRTKNDNLFCLRMEDTYPDTKDVMPPFKKGFFFISFVTNAGQTAIHYDQNDETALDSFLVFQSPGHIYSWHRDKQVKGYLIYFKPETFSFFRPDFEKEFSFFSPLQTNFFRINKQVYTKYEPDFIQIFKEYETVGSYQYQIASLSLLTLLYRLKDFTASVQQWNAGFNSLHDNIFQRYLHLINNYYLEKRTVEEYANLLSVSGKHLSAIIKEVSGRNALSFINERIITEAKTLIQFTKLDIAEIAYQLNFNDAANFGKFFKKQTGMTPLHFRKNHQL